MKDAYLRFIDRHPFSSEWRNGCPTVLVDSIPSLVVRKTLQGSLEIFDHFKHKGLSGI